MHMLMLLHADVSPEHLFGLAHEGLLKAGAQARALSVSADAQLSPHEVRCQLMCLERE
jgi:hypothetical protein